MKNKSNDFKTYKNNTLRNQKNNDSDVNLNTSE